MIQDWENRMWQFVLTYSPPTHRLLFKRRRAIKFLMSGGSAAAINIGLLYLFTDIFGIWYLFSAVMAFMIAFVASFCFQKFWTFEDHSMDAVHGQAAIYLAVAIVNLGINTGLIYIFVEFFAVHYVLAQVFSSIAIACESFFVYRKFIFHGRGERSAVL